MQYKVGQIFNSTRMFNEGAWEQDSKSERWIKIHPKHKLKLVMISSNIMPNPKDILILTTTHHGYVYQFSIVDHKARTLLKLNLLETFKESIKDNLEH